MSEKRFGRLQKATAIVPLTLLSAAWTASLVGVGASTSTADEAGGVLPDGSRLPASAVEAPASVSSPPALAPDRTDSASVNRVVRPASTSGIPPAALSAYQRAEAVLAAADEACDLSWQLLAAIGRVESDHGRFGGSELDHNGLATPGIYGVPLDGRRGTSRILDTDAGRLDRDTKFDRAVGPMQFIPSTWSVVGVDGDADGTRDPQDVDDAALASGVYLCSGDESLAVEKGQRAAIYRYNHSNDYVDLVLAVMRGYGEGDWTTTPDFSSAARVAMPGATGPAHNPSSGPAEGKAGKGRKSTTPKRGSGRAGQPGRATGRTPSTPTTPQAPPPQAPPTQAPPASPTPKVPSTQPTVSKPSLPPAPPLPAPTLPTTGSTPIDRVLTHLEARAQCVAEGVPVLAVAQLQACIDAKLAP